MSGSGGAVLGSSGSNARHGLLLGVRWKAGQPPERGAGLSEVFQRHSTKSAGPAGQIRLRESRVLASVVPG